MGWTAMPVWVTGQVVGASDLNTYLSANMSYVMNGRGGSQVKRNNAADYTTASTSFVDVDSTNVSITAVVNSGKVQVSVSCVMSGSSTDAKYLDVTVDGTRQGGTNGIVHNTQGATDTTYAFSFMVTGLSVGSHIFRLQWKTTAGTLTMRSTAADFVWFEVEEIG